MNALAFLDLIEKADNLENADLKKALKLQDEYPYFLAPKILAAKYEWDKASSASTTLLHWAAVVSPDRKRLKSLLTGTSPIVKERPGEAPTIEVPYQEVNSSQEPEIPQSEQKELAPPTTTSLPDEGPAKQNDEFDTEKTARTKREEILRRLEENLKKIKKAPPSPGEHNPEEIKKKDLKENKPEERAAGSDDKKKQKKPSPKKNKKSQQKLIDEFKEKPIRLTKDKMDESVELPDLSEESTHLNENMVSESFAKLLAKQNKKEEAIEIYQKLILNFPKKRTYFADQIEKLRE